MQPGFGSKKYLSRRFAYLTFRANVLSLGYKDLVQGLMRPI